MKKINCILLVDDNPGDNYFNEYIIKDAHVCNHVKIAINGLEALAYVKKTGEQNQADSFPKPDIIFLDINMPLMNGFEFLEAYEKLDEQLKSKVLVVMLTTSFNADDRKRAMAFKEVSEFKIKPLSVEMFHDIIERHF